MIGRALLIVGAFVSAGSPAIADDLPVLNKSTYPVRVWVKRGSNKYSAPLRIAKEGKIALDHNGTYYIVVRDKYGRDKHVGRYDLRKELEAKPGLRLIITDIYGGETTKPIIDAELMTEDEYKKRHEGDE